jgi:hypothetical protein
VVILIILVCAGAVVYMLFGDKIFSESTSDESSNDAEPADTRLFLQDSDEVINNF